MTRRALLPLLAAVTALSACGADGPPERPEPRPQPGVTVSGTVEVGITGGG